MKSLFKKQRDLRLGDPLSDDTDIGPLVNANALEKIDSQVKEAVREGAEVLVGGEQIRNKGYFYKPTVLGNVNPKMSIAQEEVFGPVAPIIVAE